MFRFRRRETIFTEPAWMTWPAPGNILREDRYQPALRSLVGPIDPNGHRVFVKVLLSREPTNTFDPNAIRATINSAMVGYIGRDLAAIAAPILDGGGFSSIEVFGLIRGGWDTETNLGCHLWMNRQVGRGPTFPSDDLGVPAPWPPNEE